MNSNRLTEMTDAQLIDKFALLAHEAGSAVLASEVSEANRAILGMWAIEKELRSRGEHSRTQLLSLLDHKDRLVRYYAAKKLLGLAPDRARTIIEWNAEYGFDAIAGDARGLLRAFDTGTYRPD